MGPSGEYVVSHFPSALVVKAGLGEWAAAVVRRIWLTLSEEETETCISLSKLWLYVFAAAA